MRISFPISCVDSSTVCFSVLKSARMKASIAAILPENEETMADNRPLLTRLPVAEKQKGEKKGKKSMTVPCRTMFIVLWRITWKTRSRAIQERIAARDRKEIDIDRLSRESRREKSHVALRCLASIVSREKARCTALIGGDSAA